MARWVEPRVYEYLGYVMFQNLFFFASCVGTLVVVDHLRSSDASSLAADAETLAGYVAEFDISEISIPDQDELMSNIGTIVDELPEIGARVDETVIRPSLQKIATVLQIEVPASDGSAQASGTVPSETVVASATATAPSTATSPTASIVDSTEIVHFDLNTASLDKAAKAKLDEIARILSENPAATLSIAGHTDLTGDTHYNWHLGQSRAEGVAAYLAGAGVKPSQIRLLKSYGETKPIVPTNAAVRDNRRVQVDLM